MEEIKMTMRKRAGKIYDVFLGEMHLFTSSELVATPICDSFNQHDTLKAKAELFDEAVKQLAMVLGFLNHCKDELSHRGETQLHRDWIKEVLSKAKELKC